MDDYISRKAAVDEMKSWEQEDQSYHPEDYEDEEQEKPGIPVLEAIVRLNSIPPADVRPVVHGSWDPYEFEIRPYIHGKPMWAQCSVCGKATRCREEPYTSSYTGETIIVERILNFCPNCGADMRPEGGADG